jgi:hypothetical protein
LNEVIWLLRRLHRVIFDPLSTTSREGGLPRTQLWEKTWYSREI